MDNSPRSVGNLGTVWTTRSVSSRAAAELSPVCANVCVVTADYDPERDGELLSPAEVRALLHVSRNHLHNLRRAGVLRGYRMHDKGHWKYPSLQPTLREARAALSGSQRATS